MRNIVDCVNAFLPLLNTEYELVLGRKGVAVKLHLFFDKKDCFHLMGLQYLDDRPELNRDRGKIFDEIVAGKITTEHIESSDFYEKISERIHFLPLLESILDSNETVFKYNRKANVYSMIEADYLMKNRKEDRNLYFFYLTVRKTVITADRFFRKVLWITLKIRHHGLCCIRKR